MGCTPKEAASKAFMSLRNSSNNSGEVLPEKINIYIRESTRGASRKIYAYEASRITLDAPEKIGIKNLDTGEMRTVDYRYRNSIRKIPVPEQLREFEN